jgi:hypothetical protein
MDTTPKYIKMCEQAEEIQKLLVPEMDDVLHWKDLNTRSLGIQDDPRSLENQRACYVWLPRQDQLQEMLPGQIGEPRVMFYRSVQPIDIALYVFDTKVINILGRNDGEALACFCYGSSLPEAVG